MSEKVSNKDNVYHSILLFFSDDLVLDFLRRNEIPIHQRKASHSFYIFEYDQFLEHFVGGLDKLLELNTSHNEKLLKAKFDELMHYLTAQHGTDFLLDLIEQQDDKTLRLKSIVENNLYNKLSAQELAFLAHMSVSTFKREFFKLYQQTPVKFFQKKRMERVAALLKSQQFKPIELYEVAGYETFSNFIQAFKRRFGVTPKQYQNQ
jgi:AraC-like DNA-binding protein